MKKLLQIIVYIWYYSWFTFAYHFKYIQTNFESDAYLIFVLDIVVESKL